MEINVSLAQFAPETGKKDKNLARADFYKSLYESARKND